MSEAPGSVSSAFRAFAWFFAALSMVALMSPPGATHDEWYHATSIWCAGGIQSPYCLEVGNDLEGVYSAQTNLKAVNCQQSLNQPLVCPTNQDIDYRFGTNSDQYPEGYYRFLNLLLVPSVEASFILMRVATALIISLILGTLMFLMPKRHRTILFLVILSTFSGTGYFLFASINPSSWTAFGVGVGCLPVHAALISRDEPTWKRVAMLLLGVLCLLMAVVSRWDGIPFVGLVLLLALFHGFWSLFPNRRATTLFTIGALTAIAALGLMFLSPRSLFFDLGLLYQYAPGQPDNWIFISRNLIEGLPNALWALGSVPTMTSVQLPGLSLIAGLAILSFLAISTFNRQDKVQLVGALLISVVIGLTIAAQIAQTDSRDSGWIEARYSYPLLILLGSWWFLTGPELFSERVHSSLRYVSIVTAAVFALSMFAVLERYVDRQSHGLRVIPDGPDQWWWSFVPFSPNVVAVLAPVFLWQFLRGMLQHLSGD